jgi:5'-AMP-activated protein kinase regulatory beta subunit
VTLFFRRRELRGYQSGIMGNQQVNGTTADTSMRPASRRGSGAGNGGGPNNPTAGANNGNPNHKPPPGGSAPAEYMQSHASQYGPTSNSGGGDVRRSTSDHSMTDMGGGTSGAYHNSSSSSSHHRGGGGHPGGSMSQGHIHVPLDLASLSAAEEDSVPTVFRWEHGGRNVYITGTFNGWSRQIPMHRSGNDFTYIHNLRRGKHAFKFIVDDEWRFAPDQPTVADIEGRINNFIDVTDFKAYTGDTEFENERHAVHCSRAAAEAAKVKAAAHQNSSSSSSEQKPSSVISPHHHHHQLDDNSSGGAGSNTNKASGGGGGTKGGSKSSPGGIADLDGEIYGHSMPDLDEYTKEPPPLPPHLRHIILNKPPQLQDTAALPVPQHVALNHLYCTAIKDNMMVLGITQRYKMKSCTTVYYSPC